MVEHKIIEVGNVHILYGLGNMLNEFRILFSEHWETVEVFLVGPDLWRMGYKK